MPEYMEMHQPGGHFIVDEQPEAVAHEIKRFLSES